MKQFPSRRINVAAVAVIAFLFTLLITPLTTDRVSAHHTFTTSAARYRIPYADGTAVTANNDHHNHPNAVDRVDLGAPDDATVVAAASGIIRAAVDHHGDNFGRGDGLAADGVTAQDDSLEIACQDNTTVAGDCSDHNNFVWIEHPNGEWTKYSHFQTGTVSIDNGWAVGDTILVGQTIGLQGEVGAASGPHLHFEVAAVPAGHPDAPSNTDGFVSNSWNVVTRVCFGDDNGDDNGDGLYTDGESYEARPCVNTTPTAEAAAAITDEDTAVAIGLTATDDDDDALNFIVTDGPDHGSLGVSVGTPVAADCTAANSCTLNVQYTPAANFSGSDSFKFKANDGQADSAEVTVSITVSPVNDAPTLDGAEITRQQTAPGTVSTIATAADVDDSDGSLTVTVTSLPTGITVTDISNSGGTITARVSAGCSAAVGVNNVGLKVTDPHGAMGTGTLTVNVTKETTPPVIDPIANVTEQLPPNSNATSMPVSFPLPTATDNCGGPVTVTTDPVSGSVFNVGTTIVNVTATDQNGNQSTSSFTVSVHYRFSMFYYSDLLLSQQALNQVTAGSIVPIRFSLSGYKGNPYSSPPTSQQFNCATQAPIGASTVINRSLPDPSYSAMFDFYQTTWQTQANWKFTCRRLSLHLNDGTTKTLDFYFK